MSQKNILPNRPYPSSDAPGHDIRARDKEIRRLGTKSQTESCVSLPTCDTDITLPQPSLLTKKVFYDL